MTRVDALWPTMGCEAGVWLAADRPAAELDALAARVRTVVDDVAARLTRFDPGSELSRLNAGGDAPASPVLARFVAAARSAGASTGGLVDATLLGAIEAAGYRASRTGVAPLPLAEALRDAPPRRPARPSAAAAHRSLAVGPDGRVHRGPGVRLDSGGLGKGLAADLAAAELPADVAYVIAVGGDLAVGGPVPQAVDVRRAAPGPAAAARGPQLVSPHDDAPVVHTLRLSRGGVATSGIQRRIWRDDDGRPAHHVLDPATGRPAWTGLVAVTAVGRDAVDAEVRAKAALLSGALGARRRLRTLGGVLQHENGRVEVLAAAPVVRLRRSAA